MLFPSTVISTHETLLSETVTTTSVFSGVVVVDVEDVSVVDFVCDAAVLSWELLPWEELWEFELVPESVLVVVVTGTVEDESSDSPTAWFTHDPTERTMMRVRTRATMMPSMMTVFWFPSSGCGWLRRRCCRLGRSTFGRWGLAMFLEYLRPWAEFAAS